MTTREQRRNSDASFNELRQRVRERDTIFTASIIFSTSPISYFTSALSRSGKAGQVVGDVREDRPTMYKHA